MSVQLPFNEDQINLICHELIEIRHIHKLNYKRCRFWSYSALKTYHERFYNERPLSEYNFILSDFDVISQRYVSTHTKELKNPDWNYELERWRMPEHDGGDYSPLEDYLYNRFDHFMEDNRIVWNTQVINNFCHFFMALYQIPMEYYEQVRDLTTISLQNAGWLNENTNGEQRNGGFESWGLLNDIGW